MGWKKGKHTSLFLQTPISFKKRHILQSTANKFACSFYFSPATVTAEGRVISNKWGQGLGGRSRLGQGNDNEDGEVVFVHSCISNRWGHGFGG